MIRLPRVDSIPSNPAHLRLAGMAPPATAPSSANPAMAPETFDQVWQTVMHCDEQLQAQRLFVDSAGEGLTAAQRGGQPALTMSSGYMVRSDRQDIVVRSQDIPLPSRSFPVEQSEGARVRALVELPLYTGGRITETIVAAESDVAAERHRLDAQVRDLKLRVAEEYFSVLRSERDLEAARIAVSTLEVHLADTRRLFEQRQVPQSDVLAGQVALANARQRENEAVVGYLTNQSALNRRLNRPFDQPLRLSSDGPPAELAPSAGCPMAYRPELAALSAEARLLEAEAARVKAGDQPQVRLQAGYEYEENVYRVPNGIAGAGVVVDWTLYDGGQHAARARALRARAEGLRRRQHELQSQHALAAHHAWLALHESFERARLTACATEHAKESLRVARERYIAGAGTNAEVLDAETLYWQARRDHFRAEYDGAINGFRLRHALGTL